MMLMGIGPLSEQIPAATFMKNHLVDGDDEEDVRVHLAALCGDENGLRELLKEPGANTWVNHRVRPYLSPPLRLAVNGGNPVCAKLLLAAGANIELEDVKGQTPLFVATSARDAPMMKVLLEAEANPEGSKKNRCSPLLLAVRDGFTEGVELLLKHGANPEPFEAAMTVIPGWPLHHAVVYAHFPSFMKLLMNGAHTDLTRLTHVSKSIRQRLSIPHAILKYASGKPEFVHLYEECGGKLSCLGTKGTSAAQDFPEDSLSRKEIIRRIG